MSIDKDGSGEDGGKILYCSFCGKSQNDVRKLMLDPQCSSVMNVLTCATTLSEKKY